MSSQIVRWWLIGSVLLSLVAAPFLARGDANLRKQRLQNQQEIAAMPESERNRLKRNFETYQSLSEAERNQLRQLHQTLEANRAGDDELNEALSTYREWLTTLEPFQRDKLIQIEDPNELVNETRRIIHEQKVRSTERSLPQPEGRDVVLWMLSRIPTVTVDDYERIMGEIEKVALPNLSLDERKALEGTSGVDRHYKLLLSLARDDLSGEIKGIAKEPPKEFRIVANRVDDLIEDSKVREFFSREVKIRVPVFERGRGGFRDRERFGPPKMEEKVISPENKLAGIVSKGLLLELFETRQRELKSVSDEKLGEFLETLPEQEQDQLLTLEASDFYSDLVNQYRTQSLTEQAGRLMKGDVDRLIQGTERPGGRPPRPEEDGRERGPGVGPDERGPRPFRPEFGDGDRRPRPPEDGERPRGPRPERGEF